MLCIFKINFRIVLSISTKKKKEKKRKAFRGFDRDYFEFIDQFGEDSYFNDIESSNS